MKVSVVILTHNSSKFIDACVLSVAAQKPDEIVIVDSGSTDDTLGLISEKFPNVHLIKSSANLGFAKGNNIGINAAMDSNPDYILILNPDTLLKRNAIKELVDQAIKLNNDGIFGPKILNSNGKIWSLGGALDKNRYTAKLIGFNSIDLKLKHVNECDFISGTCMLLPKKVLDTNIRFYEPYFLYYEDVEFCIKLQKKGFKSYCVLESKIVHLETSKKSLENIKNYYLARNHLLFVERNASIRVKLRELIRLPKTIWEHSKDKDQFGLKGIKDYFSKKYGQYGT